MWKPMLLGGLFKIIGQVDVPLLTWSEQKRSYYLKDLYRWADYYKVPFKFPTRFPMLTIKALRAYLALPDERKDEFREKTFKAFWGEDRDINDDAVLKELIGADGDAIMQRTQDPAIKKALIDATQAAADKGVFGAPTRIVDGELYWGNDRLQLVENALKK